jgi:transcriptional regulator with XRE-family HTH domain
MTDQPTDRQIARMVEARLLEIGLSQTDLAELLDAAFQSNDAGASAAIDVARLTRVAKALDISANFLRGRDGAAIAAQAARPDPTSQAALLQLRLFRAFCGLSDHRAQKTLVYLAEQLVKRQPARPGDGG